MTDNTPDPTPLPPQGPLPAPGGGATPLPAPGGGATPPPPPVPGGGAIPSQAPGGGATPPPQAEMLESSPFKDDLDKELADRGPGWRSPSGPTLYLVAAVLVVAGFVGGIFTNKAMSDGKSGSSDNRAAGGRGFGGGYGGFRNGGGGGFGGGGGGNFPGGGANGRGGMTAGTVTKVVGDTLYLQTNDGKTVTVKTTGATRIQITKTGTVKDLKTGTTLIVRGTPGSDGSMTATSVNEGGGFGGRRGQDTSGGGQPPQGN
ncbi:hypothetical protein AB0L06_16750 [Spirillospora sp. NPDC052269]